MQKEIAYQTAGSGRAGDLATAASVACAIDCVARPLTLGLFPLLGLSLAESEWVELAIIALLLVIGGSAIGYGLKQSSGNDRRPLALFAAGAGLLLAAHFALGEDTWLGIAAAVAGAIGVAVSQFLNRRVLGRCPAVGSN